jgi:hypothetical protein
VDAYCHQAVDGEPFVHGGMTPTVDRLESYLRPHVASLRNFAMPLSSNNSANADRMVCTHPVIDQPTKLTVRQWRQILERTVKSAHHEPPASDRSALLDFTWTLYAAVMMHLYMAAGSKEMPNVLDPPTIGRDEEWRHWFKARTSGERAVAILAHHRKSYVSLRPTAKALWEDTRPTAINLFSSWLESLPLENQHLYEEVHFLQLFQELLNARGLTKDDSLVASCLEPR